ncbi:MAG: hypothetical protein Q7S47_01695 [bacterium]|nr:hypothetical protein [bacterium]
MLYNRKDTQKIKDELFEKRVILNGKLFSLKNKLARAGVDRYTAQNAFRLTHYNTTRLSHEEMIAALDALRSVGAIRSGIGKDTRWIISKAMRQVLRNEHQEQERMLDEARKRAEEEEEKRKQERDAAKSGSASPQPKKHATSFSEVQSRSANMRTMLARPIFTPRMQQSRNFTSSLPSLSRPSASTMRASPAVFAHSAPVSSLSSFRTPTSRFAA